MKYLNILIYGRAPGVRILRHVLFWTADIANWLIVVSLNPSIRPSDVYVFLLCVPLAILVTYYILYRILPQFPDEKNKGKLLLQVLGMFLLLGILLRVYKGLVLLPLFDPPAAESFKFFSLGLLIADVFRFMAVISLAIAIKLIKSKTELHEKNQQLLSEKKIAELSFLKAQMHPHFLFNTLNTLYSEAIQAPGNSGKVVLHLSNLLRFILEECSKPLIPIDAEVKVIRDYIALEMLRHGDRLRVRFDASDVDERLKISPLIFLPFVENSFKHSLNNILGQVNIDISISCANDQIHLIVENDHVRAAVNASGRVGKGIANVKRQLELLYDKAYHLSIDDRQTRYRVALFIPTFNQLAHG